MPWSQRCDSNPVSVSEEKHNLSLQQAKSSQVSNKNSKFSLQRVSKHNPESSLKQIKKLQSQVPTEQVTVSTEVKSQVYTTSMPQSKSNLLHLSEQRVRPKL